MKFVFGLLLFSILQMLSHGFFDMWTNTGQVIFYKAYADELEQSDYSGDHIVGSGLLVDERTVWITGPTKEKLKGERDANTSYTLMLRFEDGTSETTGIREIGQAFLGNHDIFPVKLIENLAIGKPCAPLTDRVMNMTESAYIRLANTTLLHHWKEVNVVVKYGKFEVYYDTLQEHDPNHIAVMADKHRVIALYLHQVDNKIIYTPVWKDLK